MLLFGLFSAAQAETVIDFVDGTTMAQAEEVVGAELEWVHERTEDEALAYTKSPLSDAEYNRLEENPLVEAVEASIPVQAFSAPNDPLYGKQWNFQIIDVEGGWEAGSGRGVTVAVIDTGIRQVPDLSTESLLDGISFVPTEPTSEDLNGHGTHVAGTIAQSTNNAFGVAGIAHNAEILPIKVLDRYGAGRSEWVAAAIDEAADRGAEVINLSLGGSKSKIIEIAAKKAMKRGSIIVAAAGNTGGEGVSSPACVDGVLSVSATTPGDDLAPYSSFGKEIVLSAPGGDKREDGGGILQDTLDGDEHGFKEYQGTSMATPHVSAAAAILLSAGLTRPEKVKSLLIESATDLGEEGWDNKFGHGRLNIGAATNSLMLDRGQKATFSFLLGAALLGFGRFRLKWLYAAVIAGGIGGAFLLPLIGISQPAWAGPLWIWAPQSGFGSALWSSGAIPLLAMLGTLPYFKARPLGVCIATIWLCQIGFGMSESPDVSGWEVGHLCIAALSALFACAANRIMGERHA
jgi:serine protease